MRSACKRSKSTNTTYPRREPLVVLMHVPRITGSRPEYVLRLNWTTVTWGGAWAWILDYSIIRIRDFDTIFIRCWNTYFCKFKFQGHWHFENLKCFLCLLNALRSFLLICSKCFFQVRSLSISIPRYLYESMHIILSPLNGNSSSPHLNLYFDFSPFILNCISVDFCTFALSSKYCVQFWHILMPFWSCSSFSANSTKSSAYIKKSLRSDHFWQACMKFRFVPMFSTSAWSPYWI